MGRARPAPRAGQNSPRCEEAVDSRPLPHGRTCGTVVAAQAQEPLVEVLAVSQSITLNAAAPPLAHARLPRHVGRRQRLGHHRARHAHRLHPAPRRHPLYLPLQLAGRLAGGDRRPAPRPPELAGWGGRREPRGRLGHRARRPRRSREDQASGRRLPGRPSPHRLGIQAHQRRELDRRHRRGAVAGRLGLQAREQRQLRRPGHPALRCLASTQRASNGQRHSFSLRAASFVDRVGSGTNQAEAHACRDTEYSLRRASRSTPPTTSC